MLPTGGQAGDPEAVAVRVDDLQGLAPDGAGAAQDGEADHVPAPTTSSA
jgi:hypothetical protein